MAQHEEVVGRSISASGLIRVWEAAGSPGHLIVGQQEDKLMRVQ